MGKLIDMDVVMNEIDNMPTVTDVGGAKYIEKTCLGIKINALHPVDVVPVVRCEDRIIQEIEELEKNGEAHSDEVRQNGLLISEGLRMALRIVEEIFWEDGDHHDGLH